MKKLLWRMAAIAAFVFASCSGGAPSEKVYRLNDVEYIPVCLIDSEGWSMIAPDGKYLFKDKFDNSNDGMTHHCLQRNGGPATCSGSQRPVIGRIFVRGQDTRMLSRGAHIYNGRRRHQSVYARRI